MPAAWVSSFLKSRLVKGWLDADPENGRKGNLGQPLLLRAWDRLLRVEAAVDQQTHLQEKEGEAGDMHTFKKDKIVQKKSYAYNLKFLSVNIYSTTTSLPIHRFGHSNL